jgi:hypothetical protein
MGERMGSSEAVTAIAGMLAGKVPLTGKGPVGGAPGRVDKRPAADDDQAGADQAGADQGDDDDDAKGDQAGAKAGDQAGDDGDDGEGDQAGGDGDEPYTLAELAGLVKVPTKKLYEVVIPMGGGEFIPLGDMKNQFKAARAAAAELDTVQSQWSERENEILAARSDFAELADAYGEQLNPKALAMVNRIKQGNAARTRAALLRTLPAWSDPAKFQSDAGEMYAMLQPYGIRREQFGALFDLGFAPGVVKFLYDTAKNRAKAAKALAGDSVKRGDGPTRSAAPTRRPERGESLRALTKQAKAPGASTADKVAAINQLLR